MDGFSNYLTVPVFVSRAYRRLESLTYNDYYLRQGKGTRKLVEEILPLAAFLKHLERPGCSVKCRFLSGNQNYDAKVKLRGYYVDKGFLESSYFVEVTSAVSEHKDHLVREALARYGVIGGYTVRRVGSKRKGGGIEGEGACDIDAPVKDALQWTKAALTKKYEKKEPYPTPCFLVVQVKPDRPLNLHEWWTVANGLQDVIDRGKFRATYIVDWETNYAFEV